MFVHFKIRKRMNKNRIWVILITLLFTTGAHAQLKETLQNILKNDTTHNTAIATITDSTRLKEMQKELETARLNEANMRLEMEQLRLLTFSADSLKQAEQKSKID